MGNNGAPQDVAGAGCHWVGLHLAGKQANRDAIGAVVTWSVAGKRRSRQLVSGGSYLSSHDPRIVLGLGTAKQPDWVEVRWPRPSTRTERFTNLKVDAYTRIEEGSGKEVRPEGVSPSTKQPGAALAQPIG
jgi:enediyne biosynthesis protein E4